MRQRWQRKKNPTLSKIGTIVYSDFYFTMVGLLQFQGVI